MSRRHLSARQIVGADGDLRQIRAMRAPDDQRRELFRHAFYDIGLVRLTDQDDAIDPAGQNHILQPAFVARHDAGQQQVVTLLRQRVGEGAEQTHEEGIGQALLHLVPQRKNHAHSAGPALAEEARRLIEAKAMFFRQRPDARLRLGRNPGIVIQRARHRGDVDAGDPCEFHQTYRLHRNGKSSAACRCLCPFGGGRPTMV